MKASHYLAAFALAAATAFAQDYPNKAGRAATSERRSSPSSSPPTATRC